jgi:hypothetical protein
MSIWRSVSFLCRPCGVVGSGVGSTVDSEIGSRDVRRLGTGDEGYQDGYFVHGTVAVERCGGLLGGCPVACCRVEVRIDGAGLDVVNSDAAVADLSGQALGEHLHGSLGGCVGCEPGSEVTLADA